MKKLKNFVLYLMGILTLLSCHIMTIKADSGFDTGYDSGGGSVDSSFGGGGKVNKTFGMICSVILIIVFTITIIDSLINKKKLTQLDDTPEVPDEEIRQYVKDFHRGKFLQQTYQIYQDIQIAWMNFDLESIRNYTTDELYNMYQGQLATLQLKHQQNIMKDFELIYAKIINISKQNNVIAMETIFKIAFFDYIIDTNTGRTVRGSDRTKVLVTYKMTFTKTDNATDSDQCPNCGAALSINTSGVCEYCHSTIVIPHSDWVLSKKENIHQTNMPKKS